jgi:hypothetical protein
VPGPTSVNFLGQDGQPGAPGVNGAAGLSVPAQVRWKASMTGLVLGAKAGHGAGAPLRARDCV